MAKEKYSYGYAQEKYKPLKQKEEKYNLKLKKGNYYIIRFDGKEMTATFKIVIKQSISHFLIQWKIRLLNFAS